MCSLSVEILNDFNTQSGDWSLEFFRNQISYQWNIKG